MSNMKNNNTEKDGQRLQSLELMHVNLSNHVIHKQSLCGSFRLIIALLAFWGTCMLAAMRISTSMAIVCMINYTAIHQDQYQFNANEETKECGWISPRANWTEADIDLNKFQDGEFEWNKETQGYILASLFWGYILTPLPGALLGYKIGSRMVTGICLLISGVAFLLSPVAAKTHFIFLTILRFISGLSMGPVYSQFYLLFANWCPPNERSILFGLPMAGLIFGNSLGLGISAILCDFAAWEWIYYLFGFGTLLWFVAWMILVTDTPSTNRFIKEKELKHILSTLECHNMQPTGIPWSSILTSKHVLAIFIAHLSSNWFAYIFETNLPTFLHEQLGLSQFWNGVISVTTYLGYGSSTILAGVVADTMISSKKFRVLTVRKIFTTLGVLVPALLSFILALIPTTCDNTLLQILLIGISVALVGTTNPGFYVNIADLAPQFSGIIFAISNTLGSLPGFLTPIFISYVTTNNLASEWSIVFYAAAAIPLIGWIIYMIWSSENIQPWAIDKSEVPVFLKRDKNNDQSLV